MTFDGASSDDSELHIRVNAEVEAVSFTPEFERAPVMRRLLSFLVLTTLKGGGDELKAYSVAVDGLGRDPDFDSQSDSYPRVQVGRLRKMLDAYYTQNPPDDGVRLSIKTGGYRVDFTDIAGEAHAADSIAPIAPPSPRLPLRSLPPAGNEAPSWIRSLTPTRVVIFSVAVILLLSAIVLALSPDYRDAFGVRESIAIEQAPVLELGNIDIAGAPATAAEGMRIRALLGDGLHRSWIVRVRDAPGIQGSSTDGSETLKPDYRLSGQIVPASKIGFRLYLWLWDVRTGNQIWSHQILLPPQGESLIIPLRPIMSTLVRPFGIIATRERARELPKGRPGYHCLLNYESFFRDRDPALREPVNSCIAETIARDPLNAPALAAASFLALDPETGGGTPQAAANAAELARRAVVADPYSAEAHVADARIAFIGGQCRRGTESAERALSLNPNAPELMGLMGFLLYQCDDPRAENMLLTAHKLDPDMPAFYSVALVLSLLENGKTDEALAMADGLRPPGPGMAGQYALTQTIACAERGNMPCATRQWQATVAASKVQKGSADEVISRYLFSPSLRAKVIRYLAGKGIVPPQPET